MRKSIIALALASAAFLLVGCTSQPPPPPPAPTSAVEVPLEVQVFDAVKNWSADTYGVTVDEAKFADFSARLIEDAAINSLVVSAGTEPTFTSNLGYLGASANPALDIAGEEFETYIADETGLKDLEYWFVIIEIARLGAETLR